MRKYYLLCLWPGLSLHLHAQQDSVEVRLDEAVVYAHKFAEKKKNIAQKIDIISDSKITRYNSQNTGDLLINTGQVFVQKSQQGGSSPVLRGFEASRILIVVDGIRMNNAIYRSGHLQSIITVDQNMLERVEVMYGPGSTIYGSDALGGVIHFRTRMPLLSDSSGVLTRGHAFTRYSSANNEKTGHVDFSLGGRQLAWLQSYTYSDFGDMRMGGNDHPNYPYFGRRSRYIVQENGADIIRQNDDDRIQRFSGYRQWDITQKLLFKPSPGLSHLLNFQYSSSSDVPRYDRLQDLRNFGGSIGTTLRFAQWYYGPQTRVLGAYELGWAIQGFFEALKVNLNYQDIKESRQQREYLRYDRFDSRREHIRVGGFVVDARKVWGSNELNLGMDGQLNRLKSVADRTNLLTGSVGLLDSRYPNGRNRMSYLGFYAQHLKKMKEGRLILNDGIRVQAVSLHSTIADNSFFKLPVTEFRQSPWAVTGNLGLVYMPRPSLRLNANLSSGFRAPNIDDLARVFESSTAQGRVIIPNAEVDPEYTYNVDLGLTTQGSRFRFELTGFYTWFHNAMALAPFQLNGEDSIDYNGVRAAVYANQNVNRAHVTGFNARARVQFTDALSFDNTISYTYGRYHNSNGTRKPLDHVPPLFGKSSLEYHTGPLSLDGYLMYNGWKRIAQYNPDGEDNAQYATPDGMPSWYTLNFRGQYRFSPHFTFQLALENILDRNYRYFASGFSAPGRNLVIALRAAL